MVRYKRFGRRYKKSTNVIRMKFQSFMDIHTTADEMQIISISAGGDNLLKRLPFQFAAYKYYKIGNISVKLCPASTLPVDPSSLSLEVGEPGVDPRDQLTPGMMRITNGEDIFEDITGMSAANQHTLYNAMMLDPRWFKWSLQSGVKRHAKPRYWQVGQLHQDKWPGATINYPLVDVSTGSMVGTSTRTYSFKSSDNSTISDLTPGGSSPYGFFQTGHKGVLGWLPTDCLQPVAVNNESTSMIPMITSPPEIEVFKLILPPAYKTEYYYRAYISETVYFKDPIQNMPSVYNALDVFHRMASGDVLVPESPITGNVNSVTDADTGGNYGDD